MTAICLALLLAAPPPGDASLERALEKLERAPDDREALFDVLDSSHRVGGVRKLVERYRESARRHPKNASVRVLLGHFLRHSGRCDEALGVYAQARDLAPSSPAPYLGEAECHRVAERWPEAIEAYRSAADRTTRKRSRVAVLERLVESALEAERPDAARGAWEELVRLEPRDPAIRIAHARGLARAGRLALAADVWRGLHEVSRQDQKTRLLAVQELGRLLGRLGRLEEAVELFRRELKGLSAEHWALLELQEGLIGLYRRQGKLAAYISELERKRRTYPILLVLARLYEETGADRKALDAWRKAVKQRPANPEARNALLRILERIGTRAELVEEYRRLIKRVPEEPRYELELAELHLTDGRTDEAFALLDKASKTHSDDPGVHEAIVDLFMRHGADKARIKREFAILRRLEPDEEQHVIQLGEYYFGEDERGTAYTTWLELLDAVPDKGRAHLLLARLFAEHEMQEEAITNYREAIKRKPRAVKYYRSFATYLEKISRYRDAATAWERIAKLLPADDHNRLREVRQRIVRVFAKQARLGYQLETWQRSFDAEPPDPEAGLYLAEGLIHQREFETAARVLERLVEARPRDPQALAVLEEVYEKLNRPSDSIRILQRIAEVDPATARERLERMAQLSLELNKGEDALRYARLVVDLNPTDAQAQAHLGRVLVKVRDFAGALTALKRSLQLMPGNVEVQFELVAVLDRLGRRAELYEGLTEIVRTASEPTDVLSAGRRILNAMDAGVLERFESVLLQAVFQRVNKPVYRKLLVDLYASRVRRLRLAPRADQTASEIAAQLRAIGARGLKPILDSLNDADLAVRTRVLRVLVSSRNPNAVLPVVRLLEERDRVLRFQALVALAHIGASSAIQAIVRLTRERQGNVGPGAIWALGAFGDKEAGKALAELARTPHPRAETPIAISLALGARGKSDGLESALALFDRGQKAARPFAAWALGAIGDAGAVEPLLHRLPLEAPGVQPVIVWSLGAIASPRALEPLLRIAWGPDASLVPLARWGISRILDPRPLQRDVLRERYLALHDFEHARLARGQAFPALLVHDARARVDAARLLARHGDAVRRILIERLGEPDPTAARLVASLLESTPPTLAPIAPEEPIPAAWRPATVTAIAALTKRGTDGGRAAAVRLLGRIGTEDALARVAVALDDDSPAVRRAAAQAIGGAPGNRAVPLLIAALSSGPLRTGWSGRVAATRALRRPLANTRTPPGTAVRALGALLADPFPMVRREALETLRVLGPTAASLANPVIERLGDSDPGVVIAAVRVLAAIRAPVATKPLQALTTSPDPELRRAVREALEDLRGTEGGQGP